MDNDTRAPGMAITDARRTFILIYNDTLDEHIADLSGSACKVYLGLLRHAGNKTRECHPSRQTLAEKVGLNERTVRACLAELAERGMIAVDSRFDGDGRQTSNLVTIMDKSPTRGVKMTPPPGGQKTTPKLDVVELDVVLSAKEPPPTPQGGAKPPEELLQGRMALFAGKYAEVDPLLNAAWLSGLLARLGPAASGLPPAKLAEALGLAHRQLEARFGAVKGGGAEAVHSPRRLAEKIVSDLVREAGGG